MKCSEQQSEARQVPTLADPDTPDWYKSAVFNELYEPWWTGAASGCRWERRSRLMYNT